MQVVAEISVVFVPGLLFFLGGGGGEEIGFSLPFKKLGQFI